MRPYLVEVEANGLVIPDGPIGFIANRFVLAKSERDAIDKAFALTLRGSNGWLEGKKPRLSANYVRRIGIWHFLTHRRQNRGHAFFMEE